MNRNRIREVDPNDFTVKSEQQLLRELNVKRLVPLASNENCLGPSPLAVEALKRDAAKAHRYVDGSATVLHEKLAGLWNAKSERIVLGNGSRELIEMIARAYLEPGENCLTAEQTFVMYRIAAVRAGGQLKTVPMRNYAYDLNALAGAITKDIRIIYIANPNNPTGTMFNRDSFTAFADRVPSNVLIALDQAYAEYLESDDRREQLELLNKYPNLILLRTFSKIYGLAGLRIGYAVASPEIIRNLDDFRSLYSTNVAAHSAAVAALDDHEHVNRSRKHNRTELDFIQSALSERKIPFVPSVTNFIFLPCSDPREFSHRLLRDGILTRPLPGGIRATVGTHEENQEFLKFVS